MFAPHVRAGLIIVALALGVWQLLQHRFEGSAFLFAALLLAWGYFRHGSVHAAFAAHRAGDEERARRLLEAVSDPARLSGQDRAYYHWLRGMLLARSGDVGEARDHLLLAASSALRTENDRALAHCQLAALAAQAEDTAAAKEHLQKARSLKHRPETRRLIEQVAEGVTKAEGV